MTKYEINHVSEETLIEYEMLHTNFIGNHHEDDDSLEKAFHDFTITEVENI